MQTRDSALQNLTTAESTLISSEQVQVLGSHSTHRTKATGRWLPSWIRVSPVMAEATSIAARYHRSFQGHDS